ncbi:MAG: prepilin-type N-terminal cleavage/methylation domain-containing protein [Firmicutes bacterium]|nr:prepilin-type N-terminal cleavage/methylation domain-containing protein [Bacillota bacterium]
MRHLRNDKGFTLIELMVVILIIGILVAIAIPVFNTSRDSAYQRTCQANLRTIEGAASTYRADNGGVPTTVAALSPTYLKAVPQCPKPKTDGTKADPYTIDSSGTAHCPTWENDPTRPHVLAP